MIPPDPTYPDERLLLLAQDATDVPLLSALLQDAVVHAADIVWQPKAHRLALLANRYRWEKQDGTRVRTALRINHVQRAQRRHWTDAGTPDPGITVLELLAFTLEDLSLTLAFAGGATLRLQLECVDIALEDLSPPWAAQREPGHGLD